MTEPRAPRQVKGRYNTRRSASESSRSMYFPEMDVDVRSNRSSHDEPDFSHIKSSEDISSGYSSADNSAALTRTASVGAAARTRARTARTTVTTIKRPAAAEGNEVIIEELQDDDTFEYSNMPALLNFQSQIYLSHTDPPFLYQYVGEQMRIIQVLGENPLVNDNNNSPANTDPYDQNETTFEDASATIDSCNEHKTDSNVENSDQNKETSTKPIKETTQHTQDSAEQIQTLHESETANNKTNFQNTDISTTKPTNQVQEKVQQSADLHEASKNGINQLIDDNNPMKETNTELCTVSNIKENHNSDKDLTNKESDKSVDANVAIPTIVEPGNARTKTTEDKICSDRELIHNEESQEYSEISRKVVKDTDDPVEIETTSIGFSESDSDDEASFGTPEGSPKSKRKSPKGKYGKEKAPPPPIADKIEQSSEIVVEIKGNLNEDNKTDIKESLFNVSQQVSSTSSKDTSHKSLLINPITEKKRRHKSKSPNRIPKGSTSGIGKLLQLPAKLAFWNKTDDSKKSKDNISTSSNQSRRSSTVEKSSDESHDRTVYSVLNYETKNPEDVKSIADDAISFQDATDFENEVISHELMEKSDALQRLIEAKLESHPEYKLVPLHGEMPTTSKSTDV